MLKVFVKFLKIELLIFSWRQGDINKCLIARARIPSSRLE